MKAKIWLSIVAAVLVAGVAAGALWWKLRPQTVVLSDGTKLKLVAVTYGKHHNFPGQRTPVRANRRNGQFDSTNDTLFVWLEQQHQGNQWPNYQLVAYDPANTACASYSMMTSRQIRRGDEMVGIRFDAFPHRAGKFYLRLQEWNRQNGRQTTKYSFVISNPSRGPFPTWYPDRLPDVQSDGDLEVTLTRLVFGARPEYMRSDDAPDDPMNKAVLAAFQIKQNGVAATNWQPAQVETFDATGNHITGSCNNHWENDELVTLYQWGLWPNEPAWKLRAEFSRTSGFNDDEVWTVQNIPIEAGNMQNFWNYGPNRTNSAFAETALNGFHLKIFPVKQFTDQPAESAQQGAFQVQIDDQGRTIGNWRWSWGGNYNAFALRSLDGVKSVNVTLAFHKSRFVEFTVKPTKS